MDSVKCFNFVCIHHDVCSGECIVCAGYGCISCQHYLECLKDSDEPQTGMPADQAEGVLVI